MVFLGGRPVFADVDPDTLLIDPASVESLITPRTKAVVAVDYAGHPCDYDRLRKIVDRHAITLVADACHALGGAFRNRKVGTLADLTAFSFHPVKHITTGEGGTITTKDPELAERLRRFRNHGITTTHHDREKGNTWKYEMIELGHNYRITDIQCALGISQLKRLSEWILRRRTLSDRYDEAFAPIPGASPLTVLKHINHARHLYVLRLQKDRDEVFRKARKAGIGVNVHYAPVHLHPYYRATFGTHTGLCPVAERETDKILSLPLFPTLTDKEQITVISTLIPLLPETFFVS